MMRVDLTLTRPVSRLRWTRWASLCLIAILAACASAPGTSGSSGASGVSGDEAADRVDTSNLTLGASGPGGLTQAIRTRYASFQPVAMDTLPGWQQDNVADAWSAFRESCKALERKPNWKGLCAQVKAIHDPQKGRQLLEREFAVLMVQNADRSSDGDITGYYEPLLQGQATRGGAFVVPVYGVPLDLYALDWKQIPVAQRKGGAWVKPSGPGSRSLVLARPGEPGAVSLDLRRFTLDTLDRRLRIRLQGQEALPYYARADIDRQGSLNAPVLAWVDDPVALYAMQVQGAGRIRMADGSTLRLQYADQNGHPFKPMQLASSGNERVLTRGRAVDSAEGGDDVIEHFELADAPPIEADGGDAVPSDEPLTRGGRRKAASGAPAGGPGEVGGGDASQAVLNDLLAQGQRGRAAAGGRAPSPKPIKLAGRGGNASAGDVSGKLLAQRAQALQTDPSYVFFRVATDQSPKAGPVGALGVPLSAGRSLAVDPRVLPLGYPVFLSATGESPRQGPLQRLMFAQDTGGAIRGAVRADYFWGYGADAGRQARQTRHRGRMWLLVPRSDIQDWQAQATRLVTRGASISAPTPVCLVDDPSYCDED